MIDVAAAILPRQQLSVRSMKMMRAYMSNKHARGFDYTHQAWVVDGLYVDCGHPLTMDCGCYGRQHAGEATDASTATEGR
jgi:hypothetical protein